jgi:serine/threonine-protein kinase PknK
VTATVNGIVYAIGGAVAGEAVRTVEAYDPATQTWSNHPNLPRRWDDPCGAAVIDGKIYITGGQDSIFTTRSLYVYNPSAKIWRRKANLPVPSKSVVSAAIGGKL